MADDGPSIPSNYVTFRQLKDQWLQQQQQSPKSNPRDHQSDSQSSIEPNHDSDSKTPNEAIHRIKNHHPATNQLKPDVNLHDSGSKIANEGVHRGRNHHRDVNQLKPEVTPHDSGSKIANEGVHRGRNRHQVVYQLKPKVTIHDSVSKSANQVADNHPLVEKQEQNTDQSNSKLSTKNNSSRGRNPRFVTDQIRTGGSTPPLEPEPEPVPEKKQHRKVDRRRNRNRNQEVRQREEKTPPLPQNVDGLSHNDSRGDSVVEAVAAAVKEINITGVSQMTDRRWGSGRFHGGARNGPAKPPFRVKKGQITTTTTTVWVKKGESAPN